LKAVVFDRIPDDITRRKSRDPATTAIDGGLVFYTSAVQWIVRYGTYDKFYFLDTFRRPEMSLLERPEFQSYRDRIEVLSFNEIESLRDNPDIVLVTPTERPGRLTPIRKQCGEPPWPIVGFLHATELNWILAPLMRMALGGMGRQDALVCSTRAGQVVVEQVLAAVRRLGSADSGNQEPPFQLPLIPLGVDTAEYGQGNRHAMRAHLKIGQDSVVILYFGRFEVFGKCDLGPLLDVFARINRAGRKAVLVLAGNDSVNRLLKELTEFVTRLGCAESVRILANPTNQEKLDLYAAADIFVSPSDGIKETFGITIVEAMASGLPVVASDWDGYKELVQHGKTGFLIPTSWPQLDWAIEFQETFDLTLVASLAAGTVVDPDQLGRALTLLVDNPQLRRSMGEAGRREARARYDWRVVVASYEELWSELRVMAKENRYFSCGRGPAAPDPIGAQQLFRHYPSHMLEDDMLVTPSEWAGSLHRTLRFSIPEGMFPSLDDRLLRRAAKMAVGLGTVTFGTLVRQLAAESLRPEWLVRMHVARLLKYGVLRDASNPAWDLTGDNPREFLQAAAAASPPSAFQGDPT